MHICICVLYIYIYMYGRAPFECLVGWGQVRVTHQGAMGVRWGGTGSSHLPVCAVGWNRVPHFSLRKVLTLPESFTLAPKLEAGG